MGNFMKNFLIMILKKSTEHGRVQGDWYWLENFPNSKSVILKEFRQVQGITTVWSGTWYTRGLGMLLLKEPLQKLEAFDLVSVRQLNMVKSDHAMDLKGLEPWPAWQWSNFWQLNLSFLTGDNSVSGPSQCQNEDWNRLSQRVFPQWVSHK